MLFEWLKLLANTVFMALHIAPTGSFPQPLRADEERALLRAFRDKGDRAARDRLIEHNLRLVAHVARKYHAVAAEQEELISIGTIGLIKAVSTFDPDKGIRLATYASRCIENEILMFCRAGKKTAQDVSISEPIDTDKDGNPLTLMDVLAEPDTLTEDVENRLSREKLRRYMAEELEPRERDILERRYGLRGDGMTQREVAKRLRISRSYVSRIEKKALLKLRRRFERGDA